MTAAPSDVWGPVSVAWSFGDGSTATGTAASHTYAGAGSFVVRVTATDGSGNVTTLERTVTVAAAPPVPPVGDRTPPVLSRVRLAPDLLPTGHGAKLKVTSTEAGRLVGVVERRKQNGQWREIGAKRWSLQAGRSSKTFYGQAAQLRLTPASTGCAWWRPTPPATRPARSSSGSGSARAEGAERGSAQE